MVEICLTHIHFMILYCFTISTMKTVSQTYIEFAMVVLPERWRLLYIDYCALEQIGFFASLLVFDSV